MKLSLAWIFDHINASWQQQSVDEIVQKFNALVAEIEHVHYVNIDVASFFLVRQKDHTFFSPEHTISCALASRSDLCSHEHAAYMVKREDDHFSWVSLRDVGLDKDGLVPALMAQEDVMMGAWRQQFQAQDVIFDVDNKTLNHRPDMWGHRGFAREIAAFLNLSLKSEHDFLASIPEVTHQHTLKDQRCGEIGLHIRDVDGCKKFAGLFVPQVVQQPSDIFIASRLINIGSRPINALVDISNYVACDWSQPMHVYDASEIAGNEIIVRNAAEGESLTLLDGQTLTLSEQDMVVAHATSPMCLAGVMGGDHASVHATTTSIFIESAHFAAARVRRSSARHKVRTDSSARFEKTLDPQTTRPAILRFVHMMNKLTMKYVAAKAMMVVGAPNEQAAIIDVSHSFLNARMGVQLSREQIVNPLERLGFAIELIEQADDVIYRITIPSFRAGKDIKIKEDILEEVARCYGFSHIPHELPELKRLPYSTRAMMRERSIKRFLTYSARMSEQQNYAFFDEAFRALVGVSHLSALELLNPVSENYSRLAVSLVPGLLKNIMENHADHDQLSFYELGRIWPINNGKAVEHKQLAGIVYDRRGGVDFYIVKEHIQTMLLSIGFDAAYISWEKQSPEDACWYLPYQTAMITYHGTLLGYVGMADQALLAKIDALPESSACIFELDGDALLSLPGDLKKYEPISRYQDTYFDVSVMVPLSLTLACINERAAAADALVKRIELVDFFEKKEWSDQRSITIRCWLSNPEKTMEKEEIQHAWQAVIDALQAVGAQLRSVEQV